MAYLTLSTINERFCLKMKYLWKILKERKRPVARPWTQQV